MKTIEPHLDIADFYRLNNWGPEEFYKEGSSAWVTLPKLKRAKIDFVWLSLYFDESFKKTSYYDGVKSFYSFYQQLISPGKDFELIRSTEEFSNKPEDKIGFFYSIEGLECFREPKDFFEFYDLGVRSFGLAWSNDNEYFCGRHSKADKGIGKKGLEVVRLMKKQEKLIVDITHLSRQSIRGLAKIWPGIMVATHSNARKMWDHPHNLTDEEISLIVDRNGVVGLFPLVETSGLNNNFDDLYRHFDYIASKWGLDYVGFSSDIYPVPEYLFLNNAQDIGISKDWYDYLLTKISPKEAEKVMHGNWARVIQESL